MWISDSDPLAASFNTSLESHMTSEENFRRLGLGVIVLEEKMEDSLLSLESPLILN